MILSVNWDVSPILFSIGNLQIRYYGLLFVAGFYLGFYMFKYFFRRENKPEELLDTLLWTLMICTIVGARLGHVLFYQPGYYLAHPGEILKVWEGGLASHGGTIAILIGMWWFAKKYGRKHDFSYLWLMDRIGVATAFAATFIRLGNLMNSEIYGHETSLPWGFVFLQNGETVAKHPTQLYEALAYLCTGIIIFCIYKYALPRIKDGLLIGILFIGVFFSRFCIEFVKENQVGFEEGMFLNMGQLLSIPFVLLGIYLVIRSFRPDTPLSLRSDGKK